MESFIEVPSQLIGEIWRDKNIHIVEKEKRLDKDYLTLIDISLKAHGKDEDQEYLHSKFYRDNIRRGNTLIENQRKQIQWGRKGTPKIQDIQLEYLISYRKKLQLKKNQKLACDSIFERVVKAFKQGKRVQLVKTEKANGENAQVSYNYQFNAWIVCSKNVSMAVRTREDLKNYKQLRYNYALLIGQAWFDLIEALKPDQKLELKELLDGFTIIGEYCGNPLYQHLVRYESVHLRWFAMVENSSQQFCIDPFYVQKRLVKFGFVFVRIKNMGAFSAIQKFIENLEQLYLKTASAGLQDAQYGMEGSIVYFVQLDMKNKVPVSTPIGAGKLKTLQYRFFRKIRQKMSRFRDRRQSQEELVKKFMTECQQLQKASSSRAPFPMDYYLKTLKTGFKILKSVTVSDQFLRGSFISIIKLIFYVNLKKTFIDDHIDNMLKDENFLEQITEISFNRYGGQGCKTKVIMIIHGLPGMFKSYLGKKVGPHFERMKLKYEIISDEKLRQNNGLLSAESCDQFVKTAVNQINEQRSNEVNNETALNHYYLDGCFDPEMIGKIVERVRSEGRRDVYHKFIVIKDQISQPLECDYNEYPFNLQTIVMAYHGTHKKKLKAPTIKEKIENLMQVTELLKQNANFDESKLSISVYQYPFSRKTKLANYDQFKDIIGQILQTRPEESEKLYQRLIIQLERLTDINYLNDQEVDEEIKHLIRSSFPSIQRINFKGQHKL